MTLLHHLNIGPPPPSNGSTTTAESDTWEVLCKPFTIRETHRLFLPPMQCNPIRRALLLTH